MTMLCLSFFICRMDVDLGGCLIAQRCSEGGSGVGPRQLAPGWLRNHSSDALVVTPFGHPYADSWEEHE